MYHGVCPNCPKRIASVGRLHCLNCNYDPAKDSGKGENVHKTQREIVATKHNDAASESRNELMTIDMQTDSTVLLHNRDRNLSNEPTVIDDFQAFDHCKNSNTRDRSHLGNPNKEREPSSNMYLPQQMDISSPEQAKRNIVFEQLSRHRCQMQRQTEPVPVPEPVCKFCDEKIEEHINLVGEKAYACCACKYETDMMDELQMHSHQHCSKQFSISQPVPENFIFTFSENNTNSTRENTGSSLMDSFNRGGNSRINFSGYLKSDNEGPEPPVHDSKQESGMESVKNCPALPEPQSKRSSSPVLEEVHKYKKPRMKLPNESLSNCSKREYKKRRFKCVQCPKEFYWKSHLLRHMEVHSVERSFKCDFCGFASNHKTSLERHLIICAKRTPFPGFPKCTLVKQSIGIISIRISIIIPKNFNMKACC